MVKMNFTNDQVAFAYAIYMMVGSCFQKTACSNTLLERKMRLQYMEQKVDNQCNMEEICLKYIEEKILPVVSDAFWKEEMHVHFYVSPTQKLTEIYFYNNKYMLCVKGKYAGKHSWIRHEVWKK